MQQFGIETIYGNFDFDSWIQRNGKYLDVVWLSRPHISIKYIEKVKNYTKAQILYYVHDLHYLREKRRYEIEKDPNALRESERLKAIEFSLFNRVDVILTPSNIEKKILLSELPGVNVEAIPAYMYEELAEFSEIAGFRSRKDVLFLGGFGHPPNVDGALWFLKEILPLLTASIPDLKFIIAGSKPPQNIQKLTSKNIVVTGFIKDLAPQFSDLRVFVSPLRYGAGVKGKIITSMSYGVPVVTTSVGAEGIGLEDRQNALIVDDAKKFAEAVLELYRDEDLWNRLSQNSLKFIKDNFSTKSAEEKISSIINCNRLHN
jgi:glycosyltransferase involved in cell wall biosynthesis